MGRMGEEIDRLQPDRPVSLVFQQTQVSGQGGRVTGEVDDMGNVQRQNQLESLGTYPGARRVEDEEIEKAE